MSCRYWSNAPDAVARKKTFALLVRSWVIPTPGWSNHVEATDSTEAPAEMTCKAGANIEKSKKSVKKIKFSTSQIVCHKHVPDFVHLTQTKGTEWPRAPAS